VVVWEYNNSVPTDTGDAVLLEDRERINDVFWFALDMDLKEGFSSKKDRDRAFGRLVRGLEQ
jgi:hypothetical protein